MEVLGKIKVIGAEQQVSPTFKKMELVIVTDEQYPQTIAIEFCQDKVDLAAPYKVGEAVKVHINLGGREWVNPQGETKYFNSIKGWRIEKVNAPAATLQQAAEAPQVTNGVPNGTPAEAFAPATDFKEEEHDDLPF